MNDFLRAEPATLEFCLPSALRKPRLRRWEVSQYLRLVHGIEIAPATLAKWATVGGGPPYQKVNRTPLYPTVSLDEWATMKLGVAMHSSSEGRGNGYPG